MLFSIYMSYSLEYAKNVALIIGFPAGRSQISVLILKIMLEQLKAITHYGGKE